jgi:hypothetical protein
LRAQRRAAVLRHAKVAGLTDQPDATDVEETVYGRGPIVADELEELREVVYPAEPTSTQAVTPVRQATGVGRMPR